VHVACAQEDRAIVSQPPAAARSPPTRPPASEAARQAAAEVTQLQAAAHRRDESLVRSSCSCRRRACRCGVPEITSTRSAAPHSTSIPGYYDDTVRLWCRTPCVAGGAPLAAAPRRGGGARRSAKAWKCRRISVAATAPVRPSPATVRCASLCTCCRSPSWSYRHIWVWPPGWVAVSRSTHDTSGAAAAALLYKDEAAYLSSQQAEEVTAAHLRRPRGSGGGGGGLPYATEDTLPPAELTRIEQGLMELSMEKSGVRFLYTETLLP
jgi:hypothetical protein